MNTRNSFRTVLCMFLLSGYLLASPTMKDFKFDKLKSMAKSYGNALFVTPQNIQENCLNASLETFKNGLNNAKKQCNMMGKFLINQALESLDRFSLPITSNCTKELAVSNKTFAEFLEAFEDAIQLANTIIDDQTPAKSP